MGLHGSSIESCFVGFWVRLGRGLVWTNSTSTDKVLINISHFLIKRTIQNSIGFVLGVDSSGVSCGGFKGFHYVLISRSVWWLSLVNDTS